MFREMRRKNQELSRARVDEILTNSNSGVLSLIGDEGYPYGVPLSFVYYNGKLIFHCAKIGHKIDAIKNNEKASFTIIEQDEIVGEEYTTYFRSVIAFGKVRILEDEEEIRKVTFALGEKYYKGHEEKCNEVIEKAFNNLACIEFDIEHITGKEAIELIK